MCASGVWPSLRTVRSARTAICCATGAEMHIHIEGGEGEGLAFGVGGDGRGDGLAGGFGAAGPAVVVVWPFSSVEREKMT